MPEIKVLMELANGVFEIRLRVVQTRVPAFWVGASGPTQVCDRSVNRRRIPSFLCAANWWRLTLHAFQLASEVVLQPAIRRSCVGGVSRFHAWRGRRAVAKLHHGRDALSPTDQSVTHTF